MNEKTNKKQQRLLEMTEHPERFTDEELESMLHDPDMQDTLRMLALTRRAADAHLHDTADATRSGAGLPPRIIRITTMPALPSPLQEACSLQAWPWRLW